MAISVELGAAHRVELSNGPLHYRDAGDGPTLVFVHGVFVNGDLWRGVVGRLSDRFRCITPDWPLGSHAEPMHPDADLSTPGLAKMVAEFLSAIDAGPVTLIGNDTGGAVCQLVVADHRERIERLVLTSCDAFEVYPPSPFAFLKVVPTVPGAAYALAQSLRLRAVQRLPIAYGWVTTDLPPPDIMRSYTRPLLDPAIRRDAKKLLRGISKRHTKTAPSRFADFSGPVLLAWAGEDRLFPLSLAHRLAQVLPQARVEIVPGARTFISEDDPAALAGLLDDFVGDAQG